ncbi:phosphotriesterase family protein [Candidatus Leptofilum sp.]|uniref:phosphotriesterase family protein n=1 Tax=Candidatus Leptofilum sp. TaxID=3241576 RepID=UPI003B5C14B9
MSNPRLMTVLGPIAPAEMGIVDAHTHVWIEPVANADPDAPVLFDETAVLTELCQFKAAGGSGLVDCQPGGCGRNGRMLSQLAEQSGVHIVACTGFHRRIYYPPDAPLWQIDAEAAADLFVTELRDGLMETAVAEQPVRAGFIKIAGEATMAATPQHLLEAAAMASLATGAAIEMHTEKGAAVEEFLQFFVDQGVDPQRLVFCHVDKRPDFAFHQTIAQAGAMLEYDTFFRPKYQPEQNVWPLLMQMIETGLAAQIALATDMADSGMWQQFGGQPGMSAFMTHIQARLVQMGVDDTIIKQLMGGNIANRLAIPQHRKE